MSINEMREILSKKKFAVVGSFKNESKVAYQVVQDLLLRGYDVYPVNPNIKEILGLNVYASVKDLPDDIEAIDIVTQPEITEKIVQDCKDRGIKYIWIQPGAESDNSIKFCEDNGLYCVHDECIMAYRFHISSFDK